MLKKVVIGLIVLAVIGGGVYAVMNQNNNTKTSTAQTPAANQKVAATITYSNSGFSPSKTVVKAGDAVAITNTSSSDMQLDSDPHPVHTDDPDLNVGTVSAGQTKTFVVTQKGTFGFHNHLNPSDTGNITVQ